MSNEELVPMPPVEEVAQAIVDIAAGMKKLSASRLKREAIVLLLHEMSKVGKPAIRSILNDLARMDSYWLKPLPIVEVKK